METAKLEVFDRNERGTAAARRLRLAGDFPVNLYGLGRDPRAMKASNQSFDRILDMGVRIVELLQEDKKQVVLIKDVQFDALGSKILHADFMRIDSDKVVHVNVPVVFIGLAPSVTDSVVDRVRDHVQLEVLPLEIPREFVVNLSKLEVGSSFTVSDLEMPGDCKLFDHHDDDVIAVNHVKSAEEEAEPVDGDESVEPEVIGAKPDDGDED